MARAFFLAWRVARHRFRVSAALARNDAVWMAFARHDAVLVVIARNGAVWGAKGCRPTPPVIPAHPSRHPGLEPGSMLSMARAFFLVWWVVRHRFRVSAALARNDAVWMAISRNDAVRVAFARNDAVLGVLVPDYSAFEWVSGNKKNRLCEPVLKREEVPVVAVLSL